MTTGATAPHTHPWDNLTCPKNHPFPVPTDAPSDSELTELDSEFQGPCTDEAHKEEGCVCA